MRVLVTGAKGQLGQDLVRVLQDRYEVTGLDRGEMNIINHEQVCQTMSGLRPAVVIHCAAYTAVDQAESDADTAFKINAIGSPNIAMAAEQVGAKVCYISTDYIFDGASKIPYNEYDNTNPTSIYGKSKRAGEQLIRSLCSRYFIVHTSWVYGVHGNNFVKTMLKLGREKDQLKVVNDQVGSPTYTIDLSLFLAELISTEKYEIYHASNAGVCSWYEFASAILEDSRINVNLVPCTTSEFPRPAPRPQYSVMDHMSIRTNCFNDLRHWREALEAFLTEFEEISP